MRSGERPRYMLDATVLRNIAASDAGFWRILIRMVLAGQKNICISAMAAAELHKAINNHKLVRAERGKLQSMIGMFDIVGFDAEAAKVAGELTATHGRAGKTTPRPDYMIAGHAVHLGCVLVTSNTKHFEGFPGLKLENWLSPQPLRV